MTTYRKSVSAAKQLVLVRSPQRVELQLIAADGQLTRRFRLAGMYAG